MTKDHGCGGELFHFARLEPRLSDHKRETKIYNRVTVLKGSLHEKANTRAYVLAKRKSGRNGVSTGSWHCGVRSICFKLAHYIVFLIIFFLICCD